jgi:predicted kinase
MDNFRDLALADPASAADARLGELHAWTRAEALALAGVFAERAAAGFERDCHGDLHLGNVALVEGAPMIFDAIEFSRGLRCTDVAADLAFAAMDLDRVGLPRLAARLVNGYLEASGDYGMLPVLRFYEVYRAMVRAKVAAVRRAQSQAGARRAAAEAELESYVATAVRLAQPPRPVLVLMHGPSGSGKTTLSEPLLEALGAVRVRSDLERKRLHGMAPTDRALAAPGAGIYEMQASRAAYERLLEVARLALRGRLSCIVDAAFLRRAERDRFFALARELGAGCEIVSCTAPRAALAERVQLRSRAAVDASDAGLAVLDWQLAGMEPLGEDERMRATVIDTSDRAESIRTVEALGNRR